MCFEEKNETVVYDTGLLTESIKHSRTNPVYKHSVTIQGCVRLSINYITHVPNKILRSNNFKTNVHISDSNKLRAAEAAELFDLFTNISRIPASRSSESSCLVFLKRLNRQFL
jgi:hypothetical protein